MEELELQEKPGLFTKLAAVFTRGEHDDIEDEEPTDTNARTYQLRTAYRYHVTVRRQVGSFDDAMAAAQGLKRGEQQILNLSGTEPTMRQKIVDFMCGVNFAQEGTWEEIGDHIYLIVPASVYVEAAPPTARSSSLHN